MITLLIIALTCLVSIAALSNPTLFSKLLFNAHSIHTRKEWYRFVSHALIHADWMHLAMNLYVLFMFGKMVENNFQAAFGDFRGEIYFLVLYVLSVVASSVPSYHKNKDNYHYNAVGASGAVSAVVFAAIMLHPTMRLSLMFIPIPIPAPIFGVLYLLYCRYAASNARDNVAHDVHYWGSIFGAAFTLAVLPSTFLGLIEAVLHIF
jgi:membrane associated rhomboid family serine protease